MAQSYKQIQKQIEALQRQADKIRDQEVKGVVDRIKVAIAHYGLTAEQLGLNAKSGGGNAKARAKKAAPVRAAKYSDGQGNSWSGMGKRPFWLRDALNAGRALEEFATESAPPKLKAASRLPSAFSRAALPRAAPPTSEKLPPITILPSGCTAIART